MRRQYELDKCQEGGERLDDIYEQHLRPLVEGAFRALERLGGDTAQEIDPRSFVLLISTGANSLFNQSAFAEKIGGPAPFSEEAVERHIQTVTRIILSGVLGAPVSDQED